MIVRSAKSKTHRAALEAEDRQEFMQRGCWVSGCWVSGCLSCAVLWVLCVHIPVGMCGYV